MKATMREKQLQIKHQSKNVMVYETADQYTQFHIGPLGAGVESLMFAPSAQSPLGCTLGIPDGTISVNAHPAVTFREPMKDVSVRVLQRDGGIGDLVFKDPVYKGHFLLGSQKSLSASETPDRLDAPWRVLCPAPGKSSFYDLEIKGTTAAGKPLVSHSMFSAARAPELARTGVPSQCLDPNIRRPLPVPPMLPLDPNDFLPFNYMGLDML